VSLVVVCRAVVCISAIAVGVIALDRLLSAICYSLKRGSEAQTLQWRTEHSAADRDIITRLDLPPVTAVLIMRFRIRCWMARGEMKCQLPTFQNRSAKNTL
jgi:hypothetical protein